MPVVRRLALAAVLLLGWCAGAPAGRAAAPDLKPFVAVYALKWHAFTAGHSTVTLKQTGPQTYVYRSVNRARGLFRLAFPDAIVETSRFTIVDGQVRPLSYEEVNDPDRSDRNVRIDFDWQAGRVHGVQHGKPVDQPLASGTQDPLSVQIELMRELEAGEHPTRFVLFDQDVAKRFHYTLERTVRIDTALGPLDTVVYRSDRPGAERVLRLWLAPSLGYLPVRAERERKGRSEFRLYILRLTRAPEPPAPASGLR